MSPEKGSHRPFEEEMPKHPPSYSPDAEPAAPPKPETTDEHAAREQEKTSWLKKMAQKAREKLRRPEKQPTPQERFDKLVDTFTDYEVLDASITIPIPEQMTNVPAGAEYLEVTTKKERGTGAFHEDSEGPKDIVAPAMYHKPWSVGHVNVNLGSNFDSVTTIRFKGPETAEEIKKGDHPVGFTIEKKALRNAEITENVSGRSEFGNPRRVTETDAAQLADLELIARMFNRQGGFEGFKKPPTPPSVEKPTTQ